MSNAKTDNGDSTGTAGYHPDPVINEGVRKDVVAAEVADLAAGLKPRLWQCPRCHRSHSRGHHNAIGNHRCLWCGHEGDGGIMYDETEEPPYGR